MTAKSSQMIIERSPSRGISSERIAFGVSIAALTVGLYLTSLHSYLLFHSLVEITTIAIALTLFIITWNTRAYMANSYLRQLGIGYAFIALIDLIHTLAYKGMGVFPGNDANLPTQLWLAARYLQAVMLVVAPLFVRRKVDSRAIIGGYAAIVSVLLATVFSGNFPDCFVEGRGLTTFKIGSEYAITALLLASLCLLARVRSYFSRRVFLLITLSIVCTSLSEISFTKYVSVYGPANMIGHLLKLAAFYLVYRAILVTGLREPFDLIFRDLKQTEQELKKSQDDLEEKVRERTAELRESEEKYRSLVQDIPAAVVVHGPGTEIISSNSFAQTLLGLSEDQMRGKKVSDPAWSFLREDGTTMPVDEYPASQVASVGQPLRDYVVGVKRPDLGTIVWALVNADPAFDKDGKLAQVLVSFADITGRKRAEKNLQSANELLRAIVEAAPTSIIGLDLEGRVQTVWNPAAEKMLGWSAAEAMGNFLPSVPLDREEEFSRFRDTIRSGKTLNGIEVRRQRRDGTPIDYSIFASPLHSLDGQIIGNVAVLVDITERKRAEEALQRLNRELRAISSCNQVLVRAEDEQTLLQDICRIICDEAGYRMAWVGFAENDESKSVRPVAWAGAESGYIAAAKLSWSEETECGQGPAGMAIRSGEAVYVQEFASDPRMAPWRGIALQHGYQSGVVLPLKDEAENVFGVLLIYSSEPNAITPDEIRLLEELAGDLAFGVVTLRARVERRRAEDGLRESEQRLSALIDFLPDATLAIDKDKRIIIWNRAMEKMTGVLARDMIGKGDHVYTIPFYGVARPQLMDIFWMPEHEIAAKYPVLKAEGDNLVIEVFCPALNGGRGSFVWAKATPLRDAEGWMVGAIECIRDITEHKRAEDDLRRMNERFSLAANAARLGVWDWDLGKNELIWDDRMYELYGVKKEEFSGAYEAWLRGVHPDDRAYCDEVSRQARCGEREYDTEFRVVWPDGSIHYLKAYGKFVRDASGNPMRMTGVNFDITERRRAEAERTSRLRFLQSMEDVERAIRNTTDLTELMSSVLETVRDVLDCDRAWLFYPCDPDAPSFRVPMEVTRPEYPGAGILSVDVPMPLDMTRNLREALGTAEPLTYAVGTERPINKTSAEQFGVKSMMIIALYPKLGKPWVFGVHQCSHVRTWTDDEKLLFQETGRRLADSLSSMLYLSDLKKSENSYRTLAENLPGIVFRRCVARNNQMQFFNKMLQPMTGYTVEELQAEGVCSIDRLIFPEDYAGTMAVINQAATIGDAFQVEYRLRHKNGSTLHVLERGRPVRSEDGTQEYIDGVILDVTDRRRAEDEIRKLNEELELRVQDRTAQLRAAVKELEAFSYSISHDLRAPLRALDGFSQIVIEDYAPLLPEEAVMHLNRVRNGATQMGRLIDDLLRFSRLSRQPLEKTLVDMHALVTEVWSELENERQGRQVELRLGSLPDCSGDAPLLKQVFVNLLANALKYSRQRDNAVVEIGCLPEVNRPGEPSARNVYYVRDNGVGFDMKFSDKLFGVFQRLHRQDEYEGTGVGLAVVHRIVSRHGGRIWAEAEPDKGATFYLTLEDAPLPARQVPKEIAVQ